jgi:MATE family multidrug resistance protein
MAGSYNRLKLPTTACFLVYSAMRQYLQGRTLMSAATWVIWLGNVFHAGLNYALIFGRLGAPALGLSGAAIATSFTLALLVLGLWLWIVVFRLHDGAWVPWDRESFALGRLRRAARLGLSVSATVALEAWAFSIATMMAGWLGTREVSSHQIVLNMASMAFMVPLGVAQGASARVGNLVGAKDENGVRRAVKVSLLLGAGVMCVSACGFTLFRFVLPELYTTDREVIAMAAALLPVAAAFQLSDGTQVVASGLLRGMARPDGAALANLFGYYAVGLPLGYVLGFRFHLGLTGIWIGLVVGLAVVAGALLLWVRATSRRPLAELTVAAE